MKLFRPLSAVAVLALAVGALSGCQAADGADGATELTIWDPGLLTKKTESGAVDAEGSFLHRVVADYEKVHDDVDIKIVTLSGDISKDAAQFRAASIAKNGPDIRIAYTGGNTTDNAKFLTDLDGVFDDSTVDDLTGWNTVREGYQDGGKLLALPYGGGSYFYVFYNKELVETAGLDLSTPPADWDEFLEDARQVQDRTDATPVWSANQEGYQGAWIIAALAGSQLGSDAFTRMYSGDLSVDDPAMQQAYAAYQELYTSGLTNKNAGSLGNSELLQGFVQGKGAFFISGGWENAGLLDAMGENVGVFRIPALAGAKYPATIAGGPNVAVSITNYSDQQDAAEEFLQYLAEPSTIDMYVELNQTEASNSKSADASVITNPYLKAEATDLKTVDNVVFPFDNVMPQSVIDLFYRLNATVYTGKTTPAEATAQLQAALETAQANG